jgi:hypothetical protein
MRARGTQRSESEGDYNRGNGSDDKSMGHSHLLLLETKCARVSAFSKTFLELMLVSSSAARLPEWTFNPYWRRTRKHFI